MVSTTTKPVGGRCLKRRNAALRHLPDRPECRAAPIGERSIPGGALEQHAALHEKALKSRGYEVTAEEANHASSWGPVTEHLRRVSRTHRGDGACAACVGQRFLVHLSPNRRHGMHCPG